MDNSTPQTSQQAKEALPLNEQETIFKDETFSLDGYDKTIKNARTALFVVAAVQVIFGCIMYGSGAYEDPGIILGVAIAIGVVFLLLGFWTKSKPYTAIVTGLVLFIVLHVLEAISDPTQIYKGVIMKVLVIVYLVKSLGDAKEAQEMKKNFDNR